VAEHRAAPEATLYRLSLYHCYLGELMRVGAPTRVTSRHLAEELSITEETVRRDISFMGEIGRPGAGYETQTLYSALTEFLGLSEEYPIAKVGTVAMLEALEVVFPADRYGVKPVAYFSEEPHDVGKVVGGITVQHLSEIPRLDPDLGVSVALVACSPGWAQLTVDLLVQGGISGILMLTPMIRLRRPENVNITQIRMPCDLKSLACRCQVPLGSIISH
jgi:redox-sensing transcriptional repressor